MAEHYAWKIAAGSNIKLKDYHPAHTNDYDPGNASRMAEAQKELDKLSEELSDLQELLWAAQHQSILVVLQGTDTSGKDGTIRHVLSHVNPQGCHVHSFKAPTERELAHDFLWRIHQVAPARGELGIFNRSQYEDVLIARVHNLVPEHVWRQRYKEINNFEKLLAYNGTIILKFFLHISQEEQEKRLEARVQDRGKAWKISASDWRERRYWDDYQQAYEDAINECSTEEAAWYIVPSDHKWYRNLAVAHTLVHTMRAYKDEWQAQLEERGRRALAELQQIRAAQQP
jgi:PPK2 family polyphosphate:nucleotide phosphotransferase